MVLGIWVIYIYKVSSARRGGWLGFSLVFFMLLSGFGQSFLFIYPIDDIFLLCVFFWDQFMSYQLFFFYRDIEVECCMAFLQYHICSIWVNRLSLTYLL